MLARSFVPAILLVAVAVTPAHCKTIAVVIGIDQYESQEITPLNAAVNDATAFAEALKAQSEGQVDVRVMTSREAAGSILRPTKANIVRLLEWAAKQARSDDVFLFYFAGHGITRWGDSYILPVNAELESANLVAITSLSLADITRLMDGICCAHHVVIMDCCRNDPEKGRGAEDNRVTEGLRGTVLKLPQEAHEAAKTRSSTVLFSCDVGQRAYEQPDGQHGVFTHFLIDGLRGAAAHEGVVTVEDLCAYVEQKVPQYLNTEPGFRAGLTQTPWHKTEGSGRIVLAKCSPAAVAFQAKPATIEVLSDPEGAEVIVNGKPTGKLTPCTIVMQDVGETLVPCEIIVRKQGFAEIAKSGGVMAGIVAKLDFGKLVALAPEVILSLTHDAAGKLGAGDALTVRLEAAQAGKEARFTIGDKWRVVVMEHLAGGNVYVGRYAVQPGDEIAKAVVTGYFLDQADKVHTLAAATPVTILAPGVAGQTASSPQTPSPRTVALPPAPGAQGAISEVRGPDGGIYVWVPPGEFMMGSPEGEGNPNEHPQHRGRITRGFWLSKCEVTNAQYRAFCKATGRQFPADSDQGDNHPVVCVSWEDAKAYCDTYGLQLPTEAQWEYAARGPEGRKYPWGDEWDKSKCCNADNHGPNGTTCPVGSDPQGASWCGALDMAGNVNEWCADWYDESYSTKSPQEDPRGPAKRTELPLRGGSWNSDADGCRSAYRMGRDPSSRHVSRGFRCAAAPVSIPAPANTSGQQLSPPAASSPAVSLPSPPPAPQGAVPETRGPDGGIYVWVPPGEFMMGSEDGNDDEKPVHRVRITMGFWLSKFEVTNAQYRAFCKATGGEFPKDSSQGDNHPVTDVSWEDAKAYCDTYGLQLPTEAQWEYAARGPEGRMYPWGDEWDKSKCCNSPGFGPGGTTFPVGSFPQSASWCGALDMAGNVREWCADCYDRQYYKMSPQDDPTGLANGTRRLVGVLRGGSWEGDTCRSTTRTPNSPKYRRNGYGFRCAAAPVNTPAPGTSGQQLAPPATSSPAVALPSPAPGSQGAVSEVRGPDGGIYVWVPPGEFMMGSPEGEGNPNEHPQHRVRITKGFWLSKYEVTNAQYRAFCQATSRQFPQESAQGDNHPVVYVSWEDAKAYCDSYGLQLPTEAQWEYAARGPQARKYPWGDEWVEKKSCQKDNKGPGGKTFPVGSFPQGASWCGALDMAGNVWEWCADWYDPVYYATAPREDPSGPAGGALRLLRGGSWNCGPSDCRSAIRRDHVLHASDENFGFRCSRTP